MQKLFLSLVLVLICGRYVDSCGCYGPTSCSLRGKRCNIGRFKYLSAWDPCVCDCCVVCNECSALLSGCVRAFASGMELAPPLATLHFNETMEPRALVHADGKKLGLWGDVCLNGTLPDGLGFEWNDTEGTFSLKGVPQQRGFWEPTVVVRGGGSQIWKADLKIRVR
ncbi:hypothetical protein SpCBS45565_g06697 [Spizellomyces sp. 'palustris']|nr:hypothetical protein SpCBS45565_g06697 [Spizellomyces sp. 'palustris']